MNLNPVILSRCRSASNANETSTCQWLQLSTSKNANGSDASTFTPTGSTFSGNLQEVKGNSLPLPFSTMDLAFFMLHTPYTIAMQAKDRVVVDSITYEIQDTDIDRSAPQISRVYLVSRNRQ